MTIPENNLPYFAEVVELLQSKNYVTAIKLIIKFFNNKEWDEENTNKWVSVALKNYVQALVTDVIKPNRDELLEAIQKCKEAKDIVFEYPQLLGVDKEAFYPLVVDFFTFQQKFLSNPTDVITQKAIESNVLLNNFGNVAVEEAVKCVDAFLDSKRNLLAPNTFNLLEIFLTMYVFEISYGAFLKNNIKLSSSSDN